MPDDAGMDTRWFSDFLVVARHGRASNGFSIPVPEASRRWAMTEGRSLKIPGWLTAGLPDAVLRDLLSEGRPRWVRRMIAEDISISDRDLRDRLLADSDPEVRWSTLCRTVDEPDDAIGGLLSALLVDKKQRLRFRAWERRQDERALGQVACRTGY